MALRNTHTIIEKNIHIKNIKTSQQHDKSTFYTLGKE